MPDLPDVPQQAWNTFAADRWFTSSSDRINSLPTAATPPGTGFFNSSSARINGLQAQIQPPMPIPAPAPPVTLPQPTPLPVPQPTPLPTPAPAPLPGPLPQPVAPPQFQPGLPPTPPPVTLPQPVAPPVQDRPVELLPQTPTLPMLGGDQPQLPTPPVYAPTPAPTPVQSPFGGEATGPFAPGTTEKYTPPGTTTTTTTTTTTPAPAAAPSQTGPIDSSTPAAFAQSFAPYAQYAAQQLGVDPSWVTAMAASESNYGKAGGNELFGIKALPGQAGTSMMTHEGEYGGTNVAQTFASYDTPLDAVKAYVNLIKNHYPGAVGATDLGTFVHGLKQGGYFTAAEPEYRGILNAIANRGDIQQGLQQGLGNAAQAVGNAASTVGSQVRATANTVSQFGDKQLSSDEAYAACGPAAAVRFAQAYGRNPTLREATDLAATVGWTAGQGMAGINSEQQLLQKLGVPTKLVGADTQAMAHEAQTGNPVTISTPGHYFYADGYNPQTGAFHVGQSGLDLRGGSEWMTPEQMSARMGPIQGALFADNPQAPAVSTSAPVTDQLSQTRDTLSAALRGKAPLAPTIPRQAMTQFGSSQDTQVQQLDQAVQTANQPRQRPNPLSVFDTSTPTPGDISKSDNPIENLGSLIGNAIQSALQSALGGGPPGGGNQRRTPPDENQPSSLDLSLDSTPIPQPEDVGTRTRQMIEQLQTLPGGRSLSSVVGVPDLLPPDTKNMSLADLLREAVTKAGETATNLPRPSMGPGGLGIFDPRLGNDPRMEVPDLVEPIGRAGEFLGELSGLNRGAPERVASALDQTFAREAALQGRGLAGGVSQTALDELTRPLTGEVLPSNVSDVFSGGDSPLQQMTTQGQQSLASGLSRTRAQQAWDTVVRNLTDSGTDLNNIEKALSERLGRPLSDTERVGLLARVDPTHQAETMVEHLIGPQLRQIGDQALPDFYNLVEHRTNQSVAEGLAKRAESDYLAGGIAPSTEERLSAAMQDWTAARDAHDEAVAAATNPRTRDQISISAAQRRVDESRAQLEAAAEAARQTAAEAAHEQVLASPTARVVTHPELRDLTIAENNAKVLNQRYERLFGTNPDNPYLETLGRQVGRAEDRAAQLRAQMGERSATRGATLEGRAQAAADAAYTTQPKYNPTPEYAGANVKLRYEQQNLDRLQRQQARGIQGLSDDVARAEKRVSNAFADVQQAQQDLPAAARAQGQAQLHGREFAGPNGETLHYDDVMQQIASLRDKYASQPEKWAQMQEGLSQIQGLRKQMLQEKVDHGLISQDAMNGLLDQYDFWSPTNMTDYMTDERPGMGLSRGSSFNVGTSGLHSYTPEGSSLQHENHVAAMIREVYAHKGGVAKNDVTSALVKGFGNDSTVMRRVANNVKEYVDAGGKDGNLLHPDYSPRGNEHKIVGMIDGKRQEYVTDNKLLKTALDQMTPTGDPSMLASILQAPAKIVRMTATERNPAFQPVNLVRDAYTYAARQVAAGGARGVPGNLVSAGIHLGPAAVVAANTSEDDPNRNQKIMAALALGTGTRIGIGKNLGLGPSAAGAYLRAFADAMSGVGSGRVTGEGARALEASGGAMRGGGVTGRMTQTQAPEQLRKLTRSTAFVVRNGADLKQLLGDVAAFGWVKALGNRFEQVPRIATRELALARGESPLEAMRQAREVTTDFNRGGRFTKEINRYVPFFNVGVQASAQLGRLLKEHPAGAAYAGLTLLGAPASASEAWNYADPQRAQDYEDVPDYLKKQGVVLMLPGEAPVDKNGNRVPQKIVLPVPNEFMPFVEAGREAFHHISGQGLTRGAGEMAGTLAQELSPINAGSRNAVASGVYGLIPPPLSTVASLNANKDWFRGSTIANQFSDENASTLAKGIAPTLEQVVTQLPGLSSARVRPSQIDFALKDLGNGMAQQGLNLSDLVAGRAPRVPDTASELPVVGSLASRFVRGTGGAQWEDVRQPDQMLAPDVRQQIRSLGGKTQYYEPTPVPSDISKIPLRQSEQVEYQRLTNQFFDEQIRKYMATPSFSGRDVVREQMISHAMDAARSRAQAQVLKQIRAGGSSVAQRLKQQSSAF